MKISDALRGVTHLGIDTAPFIYFIEQHTTYFTLVQIIFKQIDSGTLTGFSAVLTLTEVLSHPLKLGKTALVKSYEGILLNSSGFQLIPIDAKIARTAADLRARYNLKTPDALQVATAIESGCQAFLTNDLELKRVQEITALVLDELET